MNHYSNQQVENAKKVIEESNLKQNKLKAVKKEISEKLRGLDPDTYAFKINKDKGEVIFSILIFNKVKIGVSKCNSKDIYNKDLGRLIAMRKAYGEPVDDLIELAEPKKSDLSINSNGIYFNNVPLSGYSYSISVDGRPGVNCNVNSGFVRVSNT